MTRITTAAFETLLAENQLLLRTRDQLKKEIEALKAKFALMEAQSARQWDLAQKQIHLANKLVDGFVMMFPKPYEVKFPSYEDVKRGKKEAGTNLKDIPIEVSHKDGIHSNCPVCRQGLDSDGYCFNCKELVSKIPYCTECGMKLDFEGACANNDCEGAPLEIPCGICGHFLVNNACPNEVCKSFGQRRDLPVEVETQCFTPTIRAVEEHCYRCQDHLHQPEDDRLAPICINKECQEYTP
jgi:hypothetical protein